MDISEIKRFYDSCKKNVREEKKFLKNTKIK